MGAASHRERRFLARRKKSASSDVFTATVTGGRWVIRVVDATTGRVLEVQRVEEPIDSSGFDVSVGYNGLSLGGNKFCKTPLDLVNGVGIDNSQIPREAVNHRRIAQNLHQVWYGPTPFVNAPASLQVESAPLAYKPVPNSQNLIRANP